MVNRVLKGGAARAGEEGVPNSERLAPRHGDGAAHARVLVRGAVDEAAVVQLDLVGC